MDSWRSWHLPEESRASSSQTIISKYKSSLLNSRVMLLTGIPNLNPDLAATMGRVKPHRQLWNCKIRLESLLEIYNKLISDCGVSVSIVMTLLCVASEYHGRVVARLEWGPSRFRGHSSWLMRIREECVPTLLTTYLPIYLPLYLLARRTTKL